jgi:hypothetical protein
VKISILCLTGLVAASMFAAPLAADKAATPEPRLPVIDRNACPFEGCTFGKWIVKRETAVFDTWEQARKQLFVLQKGAVVTGLTGVHIVHEPDRIRILKLIPELQVQPGDVILRYMYHGEGASDLWVKGQWKKEYDTGFVTELDNSGCLRDCSAKVISQGRKEWWARLKNRQGQMGWTKVEDQFDCVDALGGNPKCDSL